MILLAVSLMQQCVSYWNSMVTRYNIANMIVLVPLLLLDSTAKS